MYIGSNSVARKITGGYIGVGGVARKIIKGYTGIGGVARLIMDTTQNIAYVGRSPYLFAHEIGEISVELPVHEVGDLLLLAVNSWIAAPTTPSGWTSMTNQVYVSGSTNLYMNAYYKFAGVSESTVTVVCPGGNGRLSGIVHAFRGVNSTPINAQTTGTDSGTTYSITGPTSTVDGCMVVYMIGFQDGQSTDNNNYSSGSNASLLSVTEAGDAHSLNSYNGICTYYGIKSAEGSAGTLTATTDSADNVSGTIVVALAPA